MQCILDDFQHFTNPEYLTIHETTKHIRNTYYKFGFNHESPHHADLYITEKWPEGPNHFINNNYFHFIERYTNRINDFKKYLNNKDNFITFVIQFKNEPSPNDDCKELRDAFTLKYPHLQYNIIIINDK